MGVINTKSAYGKHYIEFTHFSEKFNRLLSTSTELLIILHPRAEDSGGRRGNIKKIKEKKDCVRWKEDTLFLWEACGTIPLSRPNYDWDLFDFGLITCSYCNLGEPQLQINDGFCRERRHSRVYTEWISMPRGTVRGKTPLGYLGSVFNLSFLPLIYLYSYSTLFLLCSPSSLECHTHASLAGTVGRTRARHFF